MKKTEKKQEGTSKSFIFKFLIGLFGFIFIGTWMGGGIKEALIVSGSILGVILGIFLSWKIFKKIFKKIRTKKAKKICLPNPAKK